jgi:4-amino-4-deoxy-L-arabinose transferase-like glycosyltransferase
MSTSRSTAATSRARRGSAPSTPAPGRPSQAGRAARSAHAPLALLAAIGLAGLISACAVFVREHGEGDEVVYRFLVMQLDAGHGYTLAGTPLIGDEFPAAQYGRALFFHPPGGVVFFWMLFKAFGVFGLGLAQLLAFGVFFVSMVALSRRALNPPDFVAEIAVAIAAAFTPIVTHVTAHFWLDAPLIAGVAAAAALWVHSVDARSVRGAALAGLVLGAATWVKATALVAVPPLLFLALARGIERGAWLKLGLVLALVTVAVHTPWLVWQWRVFGTPFPVWAGRPDPALVAGNAYVRYLTVVRPPWIYLTGLPVVTWTLVPALLAWFVLGRRGSYGAIGLACVAWIAFVLAVHVALGAIGYSKVLRYVILVVPACVLLVGVAVASVRAASAIAERRALARAFGLLLGLALALEVTQGVVTAWRQGDLIEPLMFRDLLVKGIR